MGGGFGFGCLLVFDGRFERKVTTINGEMNGNSRIGALGFVDNGG